MVATTQRAVLPVTQAWIVGGGMERQGAGILRDSWSYRPFAASERCDRRQAIIVTTIGRPSSSHA
jgi:hypothetical protein